jgi:hypothetical protein
MKKPLNVLQALSLVMIAIVVIIFALNLVDKRTQALNDYGDCVTENNQHRLPPEVAWEVYADICVPVRNDNQK